MEMVGIAKVKGLILRFHIGIFVGEIWNVARGLALIITIFWWHGDGVDDEGPVRGGNGAISQLAACLEAVRCSR